MCCREDVLFMKRCTCKVDEEPLHTSSFGIGGDLKKYGEQVIKSEPYVIFDLVKQLSKEYDHIVLDLSPGLGNLETSALIASDEIITPMTPEIFSLDGLEIFIHELEGIKKRFNSSVAPQQSDHQQF